MCAHYTLSADMVKAIVDRYRIGRLADPAADGGSAPIGFYPSRGKSLCTVPVVVQEGGERLLALYRWDLVPSWWDKPVADKKFSSFNARADSLRDKATFRGAWRKGRRCLLPANAFYEWPDKDLVPAGVRRVEHRIGITDQPIFSMAGIWDECERGEGKGMRSCAIVTTDANSVMGQIPHSRMPVILHPGHEAKWLDPSVGPDDAYELLGQYPGEHMSVAAV